MRIVLDECLDEDLRHEFTGHDCQTCRFAGFKGLSNGQLLSQAESAGFDVLVTTDQNMSRQQNFANRKIALLVIRSRTNDIEDIRTFMPEVLAALRTLKSGDIVRIGLL